MFDKLDPFNFNIVRMPSTTSNVPSITLYSSTMSEFLRIAWSTLLLKNIFPIENNLSDRKINQGGFRYMLLKQIKKAFNRHPEAFQSYNGYRYWNVIFFYDSKGVELTGVFGN